MNDLLQELFALFESRYRILRWEAAEAARKEKEALAIPDTRAEQAADHIDLDALVASKKPAAPIKVTVDNSTVARPREAADAVGPSIKKKVSRAAKAPTQEDRDRAATLETHDAVIAIFESYITNPEKDADKVWPTDDKLSFDQLYGYHARRVTQVMDNPPKRTHTGPVNASETGSEGRRVGKGKGKARDRGETLGVSTGQSS